MAEIRPFRKLARPVQSFWHGPMLLRCRQINLWGNREFRYEQCTLSFKHRHPDRRWRTGRSRDIRLVKSSGDSDFDKEALDIAHRVSYPASGSQRTLAMVLGFNQHADKSAQTKGARLVQAWLDDQRVMLANKTTAQQPDS